MSDERLKYLHVNFIQHDSDTELTRQLINQLSLVKNITNHNRANSGVLFFNQPGKRSESVLLHAICQRNVSGPLPPGLSEKGGGPDRRLRGLLIRVQNGCPLHHYAKGHCHYGVILLQLP